jgi:hypothetical protein
MTRAMKTQFSVLVPVYNMEKLIGATIDSVLSQNFVDYELIVIDDGSTDKTQNVLQDYGTRIKVIHQSNQGPEAARNRGAAVAAGEYLVLLDHDDLLFPWSLTVYDRVIRAFESPPLIIGAMSYFDDEQAVPGRDYDGDVVEVLKYRDYLSRDVTVGLSCSRMVVQRSVFEAASELRSALRAFPVDDHHLMLSVGTSGPCLVVREPITVAHRVHPCNTSHDVEFIVKGVSSLIRFERQGQYPGGRSRRFERHACLGGLAWCWVKHALEHRRFGLACRLFVQSGPLVAAGAIKKVRSRLRGGSAPVRVPRSDAEKLRIKKQTGYGEASATADVTGVGRGRRQ